MTKRNLQVCSEDGCEALEKQRGLCSSHYMLAYRRGLTIVNVTCKDATCAAEGCEDPARKRGLCNSHYTTLWRELNPEKAVKNKRESWRRRHARKLGAYGSHSEEEWNLLLDLYCERCAYCGDVAESRDHVIALNAGGSDGIENIVPACLKCNRAKSDKSLLVWLLERTK